MTAGWVDDLPGVVSEAPIDHTLTEAGWAHHPETFTIREAARATGLSRASITSLCRRDLVDAVLVDGWWLLDGQSLRVWCARPAMLQRRGAQRRLDSWPLLRQIELAGGRRACGVDQNSAEDKALDRATREGSLTVRAADHLAVRVLRRSLWELWPSYDV